MTKRVIVIGSGFAGLAAATSLAAKGYEVHILEKNAATGGRARKLETAGFVFDMGPSWYWMPEVFEQYFARFGKKVSDYYDLYRLDPSYSIFFSKDHVMQVPASREALFDLFEQYEPGSSPRLEKFLKEAAYKYEVGMKEFVFKPGNSILEFADFRVIASLFRLQMFQSMSSHVRRLFKNEHLIKMLEFPVLFLGATPEKTPALYSLMNHADLTLGTWYPMGGMSKIIEGMERLATQLGVKISLNQEVRSIKVSNGHARAVITDTETYEADIVVGGADYHHVEQQLLAPDYRQYTEKYWDKRTMAPSSLLFYLGINRRLKNLDHHNLFFDEDFRQHAIDIYETPQWPEKPLFYACVPSVTDASMAPEGCENLFLLIPLAPGLEDTESLREKYFNIIMDRLENLTGQNIRKYIIYKRSFAHRDFVKDYHAYKGNAYGLANTLLQTAFLKPKLRSNKVANLFFTGQLTTPGPGVPPSLISGQVVANEIYENFKP
ncbi:MAG: phytoene dehydrogenase [Saprospiraceae bacterium]|nr:MAG: phytoene dehydrogenase [Saprospiraceae bacterium]